MKTIAIIPCNTVSTIFKGTEWDTKVPPIGVLTKHQKTLIRTAIEFSTIIADEILITVSEKAHTLIKHIIKENIKHFNKEGAIVKVVHTTATDYYVQATVAANSVEGKAEFALVYPFFDWGSIKVPPSEIKAAKGKCICQSIGVIAASTDGKDQRPPLLVSVDNLNASHVFFDGICDTNLSLVSHYALVSMFQKVDEVDVMDVMGAIEQKTKAEGIFTINLKAGIYADIGIVHPALRSI